MDGEYYLNLFEIFLFSFLFSLNKIVLSYFLFFLSSFRSFVFVCLLGRDPGHVGEGWGGGCSVQKDVCTGDGGVDWRPRERVDENECCYSRRLVQLFALDGARAVRGRVGDLG